LRKIKERGENDIIYCEKKAVRKAPQPLKPTNIVGCGNLCLSKMGFKNYDPIEDTESVFLKEQSAGLYSVSRTTIR